MNKSIIFMVSLMASLAFGQTEAESPFSSFDVFIYPEYSHPGIGVIVEGVALPGKTPRFFEMEVPEETTIALVRLGGDEAEAQRVEIGHRDGKAYLPVDLQTPTFQVQYFYNPFETESGARAFDFTFATNEQMGEVHFTLQKPIHAENFTHTLPNPEQVDGTFGMVFYREHNEGLKAGEQHTFSVAYDNPSGTLSITTLEQRVAEQEATQTSPASDPTDMSNILLIGGVLIAGLFFVMKVMGGSSAAPVAATVAAGNATVVEKPAGPKSNSKFCSHCGAGRRDGSKFCHECGKEY